MFFSIDPSKYAYEHYSELMDMVEYMNIPLETVLKMPVYVRKAWIMRHNNKEAERKKERDNKNNNNSSNVMGESINAYARLEQKKSAMSKK